MKENLAIIAGYYGFDNAGDELILRSLVDQFRAQEPQWNLLVLSQNPSETARRFGVEALNRWSPVQWVGAFRRAKRFILGGGGLLQEATGPWNHAYYLTLLVLAKAFGCRTEVRAVGVDPVERRLNRWWTRFVFNHCVDHASVRDSDSQRALEAIGIVRPIFRTSDLIFQLPLPTASKPDPDRIAMAVAPWSARPGWEHDLANLADRVAEQLKVSVDLLVFFPAEDEALCERISALSSRHFRVRRWQQPEDLLKWVSEYQLIVGMRYHALALAALAERPFVGWGFQKKVWTLCRDFGQPVWSFERGWESEAVFRQIGEAWRHRDILPIRYKSRLPDLRSPAPVLHDVARIYPAQV
jgi:polysaccharide pyruvyl transferase CsaB